MTRPPEEVLEVTARAGTRRRRLWSLATSAALVAGAVVAAAPDPALGATQVTVRH